MDESVFASAQYESLQQIAVVLEEEQAAAQHVAQEVHDAFAAAMTRRDALMIEWREALRRHDAAPTPETLARCHVFAHDMQSMDAYLTELTGLRHDFAQYRQHLRRESSRAAVRVVRARRRLDRTLFETPAVSAVDRVVATADARSLFRDMREHLTVAVLAASRLDACALTPHTTRAHGALIRGLTGLTEDLNVLDPLPAETSPRLALVPVPVPMPTVAHVVLPGT